MSHWLPGLIFDISLQWKAACTGCEQQVLTVGADREQEGRQERDTKWDAR